MAKYVIDIETTSAVDITACGSWVYAEHPSTKVLCLAYADADSQDPPKVISVADKDAAEELPKVIGMLLSAERLIAHNANFEREVLRELNPAFGERGRWIDTATLCGMVGRPRGLKDACKSLLFPADKQKDTRGVRLIGMFSCQGRKGYKLPEQAPAEFAEFCEYCRQDVTAEREIYQKLIPHIDPYVLGQHDLDFQITDNGVPVDFAEVLGASKLYGRLQSEAEDLALKITGGAPMRSTKALREWTASKGWPLESFSADAVDAALNDEFMCSSHPDVAEFLELRKAASGTAGKKYDAILAMVAKDYRCHGVLVSRAAHTGRYAGRGLQPQNLPRGTFDKNLIPVIRDIAKRASRDDSLEDSLIDLEMVAGARSCGALTTIIRDCITPLKSDECLVVSDYSAIEARVLAWLAGESWVEDIFAGDGKIYERTAAAMYGKSIESITKQERMAGKISTLALGYGGGLGAFSRMAAAYGINFDDEAAQGIMDSWRNSRPKTVSLWRSLDTMVKTAVESGKAYVKLKNTQLEATAEQVAGRNVLTITIPSGRKIFYWSPKTVRLENGRAEVVVESYGSTGDNYAGLTPEAEGAHYSKLYGGKLTENIVQAIAFDVLLGSLFKLNARGLNIAFHVHDEIVVVCKRLSAEKVADTMRADMTQPPAWARGLVLATEPEIVDRYRK